MSRAERQSKVAFLAGAQVREMSWDEKNLAPEGPTSPDSATLQDYFMWRQYLFMRFLYLTYCFKKGKQVKKTSTLPIIEYLEMIKGAMVITKSMQDGTHEELVRLSSDKTASALPQKENDFAFLPISTTEEENMKRPLIAGLMAQWYTMMSPFYTRFMTSDGSIWNDLQKSSATDDSISSVFNALRIKTRWPKFPPKHKDRTMEFMHKCNIACRILLGHKAPSASKIEELMGRFVDEKNAGASEQEQKKWHQDFDFIKAMMDDDGKFMGKAWGEMGGIAGIRKMIRKNTAAQGHSKQEVKEKAHRAVDQVFEYMYASDGDE